MRRVDHASERAHADDITLSAFSVGCLGLVLWGRAYNVDNVRAGVRAVNRCSEATWALGMNSWATFLEYSVELGRDA